MSPEPGTTGGIPETGDQSPAGDAIRAQAREIMKDPGYARGDPALLAKVAALYTGHYGTGKVELGGGLDIVARPGSTPGDSAAAKSGDPANPGALPGDELGPISADDLAEDERAFAMLRDELGTVEGDATIEAAREVAQAFAKEHGMDAVNEFLADAFDAGISRAAGIKMLAKYAKLGLQ